MGHRGAWSVYSLIKMNNFVICMDIICNAYSHYDTLLMSMNDTSVPEQKRFFYSNTLYVHSAYSRSSSLQAIISFGN